MLPLKTPPIQTRFTDPRLHEFTELKGGGARHNVGDKKGFHYLTPNYPWGCLDYIRNSKTIKSYKHPVLTLYGYGKILTEGISLII